MASDTPKQGDVQTLIEAVKEAKERRNDYEDAKDAFAKAVDHVQRLIGGDGLAAIANGERQIGQILTRIE